MPTDKACNSMPPKDIDHSQGLSPGVSVTQERVLDGRNVKGLISPCNYARDVRQESVECNSSESIPNTLGRLGRLGRIA